MTEAVSLKGTIAMPQDQNLLHPWLIAAWPGMGNVALNACFYLLSKLGMDLIAEYEPNGLFDVDHVEVKEGIIQKGRHPRNRFFSWKDPRQKHDLVIFLGEAQPPLGKYTFCRQIVAHARELGVERVFTFAAMATDMHPEHRSRIFGAATDNTNLEELKRLELEILQDGHIGGLNGVLLGAAAEAGLGGACLLGEMPHIFSQLPFPKASLAILEVFTTMTGIELDFAELAEQSQAMEQQLGALLSRVEKTLGTEPSAEEEAASEEERLGPAQQAQIEQMFEQAAEDRSKAFELKQELDRLGIFKEYEDRFLDLFKKPGQE
jgi:proteasome assembly chaperone (PAC2) family protein